MTPARFGQALILGAALACLPAHAERALPQPNWTPAEAQRAITETDLLETLRPLFELARSHQDTRLLQELRRLADDDSISLPVRERLLFEFAIGLSDLDRLAVAAGVLDFLMDYQPRVLVPHEDSRQLGVPLYNIRAAVAGARHEWERQEGAARARTVPPIPGDTWLAAYLSAGTAQRTGYLDRLEVLPEPSLLALARQAANRLASEPELTPVVLRAALQLSDVELLQSAVVSGAGPGLALSLRNAVQVLDESERASLLTHAVLHAPAVNAALAMAELSPGLLHRAETVDLLFDSLGDPDLGPASALALSRNATPAVRAKLAELAEEKQGMASTRAALAVSMARDSSAEAER
jgi:hypothetical protein